MNQEYTLRPINKTVPFDKITHHLYDDIETINDKPIREFIKNNYKKLLEQQIHYYNLFYFCLDNKLFHICDAITNKFENMEYDSNRNVLDVEILKYLQKNQVINDNLNNLKILLTAFKNKNINLISYILDNNIVSPTLLSKHLENNNDYIECDEELIKLIHNKKLYIIDYIRPITLDAVKYINEVMKKICKYNIRQVIKSNDLDFIKYVLETLNYNTTKQDVIEEVFKTNNPEILKYFMDKQIIKYIHESDDYVFKNVTNLDIIKLINMPEKMLLMHPSTLITQPIAEYMKTNNIYPDNFYNITCDAYKIFNINNTSPQYIENVCRNGDLDSLKYLISIGFTLSFANFLLLIEYSHMNIIIYTIETLNYKFTDEQADEIMIHMIQYNNDINMLKYLKSKNIINRKIVQDNNTALQCCSKQFIKECKLI